MASVSPAEITVAPFDSGPVMKRRAFTKIANPSNPKTTDGTPARLRMFTSMNRVSRDCGAYSSR